MSNPTAPAPNKKSVDSAIFGYDGIIINFKKKYVKEQLKIIANKILFLIVFNLISSYNRIHNK